MDTDVLTKPITVPELITPEGSEESQEQSLQAENRDINIATNNRDSDGLEPKTLSVGIPNEKSNKVYTGDSPFHPKNISGDARGDQYRTPQENAAHYAQLNAQFEEAIAKPKKVYKGAADSPYNPANQKGNKLGDDYRTPQENAAHYAQLNVQFEEAINPSSNVKEIPDANVDQTITGPSSKPLKDAA